MPSWRLTCGACGREEAARPLAGVCEACGRPLLARYQERLDPERAKREWSARPRGMWRFRERLPLRDGECPVTLQEGDTPLLPLERLGRTLGLRLLAKDESRNPTGSFKDRGLAAAVTRAAADGATELTVPSAGNAAAALSAYAARAGLRARVFIPRDTPQGVERRCRHYDARVERVDGLIDECGRRARAYARENGAVDVSTLREPYRLEGKKTMMYEIVEALDWRAPDAIVYPTGGGTGLVASRKALEELSELGIVEPKTRLYTVQAAGCAPIVQAWRAGHDTAEPWQDPTTEAWGLRVPAALGDFLILRALRDSGGGALAVSDATMRVAAEELGSVEGLGASIEGGATLAAARLLRAKNELREGETVVLFNTAGVLVY